MWISVKCQLAIVTVDADIVGVFWKMPHIFTNAEYADTLYIYGFCDGSDTAAVEYCWWFAVCRIPDNTVFSRVFNTLRELSTLPSAHVSFERARQHVEEQEKILGIIHSSPTTSTRKLSTHLSVWGTRVWWTLHDDSFKTVQENSSVMETVRNRTCAYTIFCLEQPILWPFLLGHSVFEMLTYLFFFFCYMYVIYKNWVTF
jgi:hypothetical protein